MKNDGTPLPLSEVQTRLGSVLADVFFDISPHETKKLLGLTPALGGPKGEVWISPSDQLLGKVLLTPPLTDKCIKACTHQGILGLGQKVVAKFEQNIKYKEKAMFDIELLEIKNVWEAEKRRMLELLSSAIHKEYELFVQELQIEHKQKMKSIMEEALRIHDRELRKAIATERASVTRNMLKKMRSEIGVAVESIYDEFEEQYTRKKEIIISDVNHILRVERIKAEEIQKAIEAENKEKLHSQRQELEMQNMADGAYILCLERLRSSSEKYAMHVTFENKLEAFQKLLSQANKANKEIKREMSQANKRAGQLHWENKLHDIIREFQKFINYTFRAVPGQAEYLLNTEEILNLEDKNDAEESVDSTSEHSDEHYLKVTEIVDKHGQKWVPVKNVNSCIVNGSKKIGRHPEKCSNFENLATTSYQSLPKCDCGKILFTLADSVENVSTPSMKSMTELAEGARFVVELNLIKDKEDKISTKSKTPDPAVSLEKSKKEKTCQVVGKESSTCPQTSKEFLQRQIEIRDKLLKNYPSLQNVFQCVKEELQ